MNAVGMGILVKVGGKDKVSNWHFSTPGEHAQYPCMKINIKRKSQFFSDSNETANANRA